MTYKAFFNPEEVVKRFQDGEGVVEIATSLHAAPRIISRMLKSRGLHVAHTKHPVDIQKKIAELYAAGYSCSRLGEEYNVSRLTIRNYVRAHGGTMRGSGEHNVIHLTPLEKDRIHQLYIQGNPLRRISHEVGYSLPKIVEALEETGIKTRNYINLQKRRIFDDGYVRIHWTIAGEYGKEMSQKRGSVLEHRVVMANHLKRVLRKDETVHHINGNKADNRIENLQLRQGRHGNGVKFVCGDCGSHNIKSDKL